MTNEKVIAINQDGKGKACKRVKRGITDILAKPLSDGTAFCFFNRAPFAVNFTCDVSKFSKDAYLEFEKKDCYKAEDLWSGEEFETNGKIKVKIPTHGVVVYKIM